MKTTILFLMLLIFLGCEEEPKKNNDEILSNMKSPVVVVSKGGDTFWGLYVTFKDGNDSIVTLSSMAYETLEVGDTIK